MKTIIVDLDGTYCTANTLHLYLRTAAKHHLRHGRLLRAAGICAEYVLRVLRVNSHLTFKTRALRLAGSEAQLLERFRSAAARHINAPLAQMLRRHADAGDMVVLATAAPETYVHALWRGAAVASQWLPDGSMLEARGRRKLMMVRRLLNQKGLGDIDLVITDHCDDLPLAAAARSCMLVNPSAKTLAIFNSAGIAYTLHRSVQLN